MAAGVSSSHPYTCFIGPPTKALGGDNRGRPREGGDPFFSLVRLEQPLRFALRGFQRLGGGLGAGARGLDRVVERFSYPAGLEGGTLGRGELELVARHRGGRELRDVALQLRRLVGGRAYRDVAGGDRPVGGALGGGDPLDELERGLALLRRGLLEDIPVAAAGGRAGLLGGGQHGDAEREFGAVLHRGEVAGGVPHRSDERRVGRGWWRRLA